MRKFKAAILKVGGMLASLALTLGVATEPSACMTWFHQPKVPQGLEKFKKR